MLNKRLACLLMLIDIIVSAIFYEADLHKTAKCLGAITECHVLVKGGGEVGKIYNFFTFFSNITIFQSTLTNNIPLALC